MKLAYAKGLPLAAALLTAAPRGAGLVAASNQDEVAVQESGNGASRIRLAKKA